MKRDRARTWIAALAALTLCISAPALASGDASRGSTDTVDLVGPSVTASPAWTWQDVLKWLFGQSGTGEQRGTQGDFDGPTIFPHTSDKKIGAPPGPTQDDKDDVDDRNYD